MPLAQMGSSATPANNPSNFPPLGTPAATPVARGQGRGGMFQTPPAPLSTNRRFRTANTHSGNERQRQRPRRATPEPNGDGGGETANAAGTAPTAPVVVLARPAVPGEALAAQRFVLAVSQFAVLVVAVGGVGNLRQQLAKSGLVFPTAFLSAIDGKFNEGAMGVNSPMKPTIETCPVTKDFKLVFQSKEALQKFVLEVPLLHLGLAPFVVAQ
jgi:hypothetical protein